MIYFVQPIDGGPVKIGCSQDVAIRLRQLESHYGCRLVLLATRPGDFEEEAEIHERFSHLRLGRTEQFRPALDLMEFIGRPLLVGANTDVVEAIEPAERREIVAIRCTPGWKDWLSAFAERERMTPTSLLDRAVARLAAELGVDPPPKR